MTPWSETIRRHDLQASLHHGFWLVAFTKNSPGFPRGCVEWCWIYPIILFLYFPTASGQPLRRLSLRTLLRENKSSKMKAHLFEGPVRYEFGHRLFSQLIGRLSVQYEIPRFISFHHQRHAVVNSLHAGIRSRRQNDKIPSSSFCPEGNRSPILLLPPPGGHRQYKICSTYHCAPVL